LIKDTPNIIDLSNRGFLRSSMPQRMGMYDISKDLHNIGMYSISKDLITEDEDAHSIDDKSLWLEAVSTNISNNKDLYTILFLSFLVGTLSSLDRVAMSVAILPLSQEYGLTESIKGQVSSIFSIGYALGILPAGILIAYASPKKVMAGGVALWSAATLATPLMASFMEKSSALPMDADSAALVATGTIVPLLVARTVMGAAESVVLPTLQKILAAWVPPEKNMSSLAVAGVFGGFQLGTITAYAASANIIDWYGSWEGVFYVYGAFGLVWLVPWLSFVKDSPEEAAAEKSAVLKSANVEVENDERSAFKKALSSFKDAPLKEIFSSKGIRAMTIAHAANNWGLYNNLAWAPTFFQEQFHLNVRDSALISVLPPVVGAICGIIAGSLADSLLREGNDKTNVRKAFQSIALFGPAVFLAILSYSLHSPDVELTPVLAQALLTGSVGLQAFNAAGYGAASQDKAGKKWSGLIYSLTSLPGVVLGSAAVYLTGQILDATQQDWSIVYGLNALIFTIGASHFALNYNSKREFE
jgi:ACS family sodium-dependent inorganic phosphate cotransporter